MKLPTGIKMNILKMFAFGQFLNLSPSGFLGNSAPWWSTDTCAHQGEGFR